MEEEGGRQGAGASWKRTLTRGGSQGGGKNGGREKRGGKRVGLEGREEDWVQGIMVSSHRVEENEKFSKNVDPNKDSVSFERRSLVRQHFLPDERGGQEG